MNIGIDYAKPGMILATPLMKENIVILNSGVVLSDRIIIALKRNGINNIDIRLTKEQEELFRNAIQPTVTETISKENKEAAKKAIASFDIVNVIKSSENIISSVLESNEFSYELAEYKTANDIFTHSVRTSAFVAVLTKYYNSVLPSIINGDKNLLNKQEVLKKCEINLESIVTATLLHDIGKLCKNKELLSRIKKIPDAVKNFFPGVTDDILKNYDERYSAVYSYLLICDNKDISTDVKMMILLSCENELGTSVLKAPTTFIKSRQNFVYGSKIIRLCNMYDETLEQTIKENSSLENVSSKLDYNAVNKGINEELEKLFIECVPLYSKGVKVLLSDGTLATVMESFTGRTNITRPIVKTIDGRIIDLRDLENTKNLTIEELSDEETILDVINKQLFYAQENINKTL